MELQNGFQMLNMDPKIDPKINPKMDTKMDAKIKSKMDVKTGPQIDPKISNPGGSYIMVRGSPPFAKTPNV